MPKDKAIPFEPAWLHVLDGLSWICILKGHTLSMYTSRKGRKWASLKGFSPVVYTTSVELPDGNDQELLSKAFAVLMMHHYPKVMEIAPPLSTWLNARDTADKGGEALLWLHDLISMRTTGEIISDPDTLADPDNAT